MILVLHCSCQCVSTLAHMLTHTLCYFHLSFQLSALILSDFFLQSAVKNSQAAFIHMSSNRSKHGFTKVGNLSVHNHWQIHYLCIKFSNYPTTMQQWNLISDIKSVSRSNKTHQMPQKKTNKKKQIFLEQLFLLCSSIKLNFMTVKVLSGSIIW